MADEKKLVDVSQTPTPMIDRNPPVQEEAKIPMNLLPVEQVEQNIPEPEAQEPSAEVPVITTPPSIPSEVDPYTGKPWREIALEEKRKREELAERLPQMIDEKLSKVTQTQQQPTYTYEQLEAYKLQNVSDPNIVAWAAGEQRKMQAVENRKLFEEVVGSREKVNQIENQKQQSLAYVQNTYPEAFKRDAQGRPLEWDVNSPITQQIFGLMKNPELASNPNGLSAAADIAYGRVARSQTPVLQKQVQQAKADVKQAQKSSLTEGAGRRVTPNALPQQTAVDTLRKTGNIKDAESAMGAVLRARGIIVD